MRGLVGTFLEMPIFTILTFLVGGALNAIQERIHFIDRLSARFHWPKRWVKLGVMSAILFFGGMISLVLLVLVYYFWGIDLFFGIKTGAQGTVCVNPFEKR